VCDVIRVFYKSKQNKVISYWVDMKKEIALVCGRGWKVSVLIASGKMAMNFGTWRKEVNIV